MHSYQDTKVGNVQDGWIMTVSLSLSQRERDVTLRCFALTLFDTVINSNDNNDVRSIILCSFIITFFYLNVAVYKWKKYGMVRECN